MVKGTTTLSPRFRFLISLPVSTTSPINSWPRMSPASMVGMKPSYRWRSEPQIAVRVISMMASRGLRIFGSGTVSTRTSSLPYQQSAFISLVSRTWDNCLLAHNPLRAHLLVGTAVTAGRLDHGGDLGAAAMRLPVGGGDFAGFHKFFEAAQILANLLLRFFSEEHGESYAQLARGRPVEQLNPHFRTASLWAWLEPHRALVLDLRTRQRTPGDKLVLPFLHNFGLP